MSYLEYLRDKLRYNPAPRIFFDGLAKLGIQIHLFYLIREGILEGAAQQQWDLLKGYEVGFLGTADMTTIAQMPFRWISYETLQSRLNQGSRCLGAKREGRIVAFTWFDLNWFRFKSWRFPLKHDEAYLFDAYSIRDLRGRGLAPALRYCLYEELALMGRTKLYSISERFNTPALKFKLKLGATILKSGWNVTLFNRWHFGPRYHRP